MDNQVVIDFDSLQDCDLQVDATYQGGKDGNVSDDPLSKLLSVGNQGGFRPKKNPKKDAGYSLCVLYSRGTDPD